MVSSWSLLDGRQGSREALGALVLGEGEGNDLAWVGNVGSGLDERARELLRRLSLCVWPSRRSSGAEDAQDPSLLVPGSSRGWPVKVQFTSARADGRLPRVFLGDGRGSALPRRTLLAGPPRILDRCSPRRGHHQGDLFAYY